MKQKQLAIIYILAGALILAGVIYAYTSTDGGGCDLRGTNFEDDETVAQLIRSVEEEADGARLNCIVDGDDYAFFVQLPNSNSYICIDSIGFTGTISKPTLVSNCLAN